MTKQRMEIIRHTERIISEMEHLEQTLTKLLGKKPDLKEIRSKNNKIVLKADCYLTYQIKGEDVVETWDFANVKPL